MKDYDDINIEKLEQAFKAQFDAIELEPAEETLAAIRPQLKKKRTRNLTKSQTFMTRLTVIAASFILLFGIGLTAWLLWSDGSELPPNYRYEDLDIELNPCEKSDVINFSSLYIPDLDIIANDEMYKVGTHKESLETVYFIVEGMNIDMENGIARKIMLTIILQEKYEIKREELYTSGNKITVASQEISVFQDEPLEPFFCYSLGFYKGNVRYYMNYQTTSPDENDVESFMTLFLN